MPKSGQEQVERVPCPYCCQLVEVRGGVLVKHSSGGLASFGKRSNLVDRCNGSGWEVPADER